MRLEQFEYLIEISKTTSISAAAQKLHLSSQALSKSITAMEDELGYLLLERSYKGVQLTEKGLRTTEAAKHFFAELASIRDPALEPLPILKGQYTLPSLQGEVNYFLLLLLATLSQKFPQLEVITPRLEPNDLEEMIQSGESELGMYCTCTVHGKYLSKIPDRLQFHPLLPCKFYALIPNTIPLTAYKSVSIKSLQPYPLIMQRPNNNQPPHLLSLVKLFYEPKKIVIKPSITLCQELVTSGVGIYLQIVLQGKSSNVVESKSVSSIPIRDDIQITYGYLTAKDCSLSSSTKVILEYIHEQAQTMSNAFT